MTLGGTDPSPLREDDGERFRRHQGRLVQRFGGRAFHDRRAPIVTVALRVLVDLGPNQARKASRVFERLAERFALFPQRALFGANLHLLEPGEMAQPEFENVLGLHIGEVEARHQDRLRIVLSSDDGDDLVDVEKGDEPSVQQVEARFDAFESMGDSAADGVGAKLEPLRQQRLEVLELRAAIQSDDVHVRPVSALQVGRGEQV